MAAWSLFMPSQAIVSAVQSVASGSAVSLTNPREVSRSAALTAFSATFFRLPGLRAYIRCLADWATTNEFLSIGVVHVLPLSSDLVLVSLDWVDKQAILVGDFGSHAMLEVLGPVRKGVWQPTDQPNDGARYSLARNTRTAASCSGEHRGKNVGQAACAQLGRPPAAEDPCAPRLPLDRRGQSDSHCPTQIARQPGTGQGATLH